MQLALFAAPTRGDWCEAAACASSEVDFFPDPPVAPAKPAVRRAHDLAVRRALEVCSGCPVREPCLETALAHTEEWTGYGIWGGTTHQDRIRLRSWRARYGRTAG